MLKSEKESAEAKQSGDIPSNFAAATSLLRSLIASRKLVKDILDTPAVATAFDLLGKAVRSGKDEERLEAVSTLGKAAEISKPIAALALPLLENSLQMPLRPTGSWGTAEDRYYLAKGISACREPWIASYAAVELAQAEVAEKASRTVWAEIAVNRAETLANALKTIAKALSEDRQESVDAADTTSRKLNRIVLALRESLPIADVPTGEGFGTAFSDIVAEAGGRAGPSNRSLREETAANVLDLMTQMLRLRFEATLDADVYAAAGIVLRWWGSARPSEIVSSRAERIARIAMSSLHILARQGVSQRNLRQALVSAFGTELIHGIGVEIVETDPSLDPAIATWLSSGREIVERRSNLAVRDISEQEFDELVARLLLSIDSQEGGPQSLQLVLDDVALFEPKYLSTLRAAIMRAKLVTQWAQAIGAKRRLVLSSDRGELVKYDPAIHETTDNLQLFARARVRIPGVIKQLEGRPATVVLKAQVEVP